MHLPAESVSQGVVTVQWLSTAFNMCHMCYSDQCASCRTCSVALLVCCTRQSCSSNHGRQLLYSVNILNRLGCGCMLFTRNLHCHFNCFMLMRYVQDRRQLSAWRSYEGFLVKRARTSVPPVKLFLLWRRNICCSLSTWFCCVGRNHTGRWKIRFYRESTSLWIITVAWGNPCASILHSKWSWNVKNHKKWIVMIPDTTLGSWQPTNVFL